MADRPSVTHVQEQEERARAVILTLSGMETVKGSSRTQLPAWTPETLIVRYRWSDGAWQARDFAMLRGFTLDGVVSVTEPVSPGDPHWPWVSALIQHHLPKD